MKELKPALIVLLLMTLVTGVVYPLLVTGIAQVAFPGAANGNLIQDANGTIKGSRLIAQPFRNPRYFWPRPSAAGANGYDAGASSGSNLGPLNPALAEAVKARIEALREADPGNTAPVPVDLVTSSASGLDPHLSPAAALYQVPRVARARGMDEAQVRGLVERHIEGRTFGILGEPRVNVLLLNLALDGAAR